MWGYKINDQNYKDATTLIRYLVKAAGMGANLLLNIGRNQAEICQQPLSPASRKWANGCAKTEKQYMALKQVAIPRTKLGTTTRKGNRLFVHVMTPETSAIILPGNLKIKKAFEYKSKSP